MTYSQSNHFHSVLKNAKNTLSWCKKVNNCLNYVHGGNLDNAQKKDLFWCLPLFLGRGVSYFSALLSLSKVGTLSSPSKNLDRPDQRGPDQAGQDFDALTLWSWSSVELLEQTLVVTLELKFGGDFEAKFGHSKLHFSKYVNAEVKSIEVWLRSWSWSLVVSL